jgi:hypothetical protein
VFGSDGNGWLANEAAIAQPSGLAVLPNGDVLIADRVYGEVRMVHNGMISTVAGGSISSADFVAPTSASLTSPAAMVAARDGTVYVAARHKVRKFTVGGLIVTVAGSGAGAGTAGYNGDNQSATTALLNSPQGLGLDSAGALYIADTNNHRVRKVAGDVITTVAGNGVAGTAGDGARDQRETCSRRVTSRWMRAAGCSSPTGPRGSAWWRRTAPSRPSREPASPASTPKPAPPPACSWRARGAPRCAPTGCSRSRTATTSACAACRSCPRKCSNCRR